MFNAGGPKTCEAILSSMIKFLSEIRHKTIVHELTHAIHSRDFFFLIIYILLCLCELMSS